jgi:hypothetical protein
MFMQDSLKVPLGRSAPEVEIKTPEVSELEAFPKLHMDDDSVSTFNPSGTRHSMATSTVLTPKVLDLNTTSQKPAAAPNIPSKVSHTDPDSISKS